MSVDTLVEGKAKALKAAADEMRKIAEKADGIITGDDAVRFNELRQEIEDGIEQVKALEASGRLTNVLDMPAATVPHNTDPDAKQRKSFAEQILGNRAEFKSFDGRHVASMRPEDFKTLVGHTTSGGQYLIATERNEGVLMPQRQLLIRDLFTQVRATSNNGEFFNQTARTNNADFVSDEVTTPNKPESAVTYELKTWTARTIAHWIPVTKNMLNDYAEMESLINVDLIYGLNYKEDEELLWGAGTGNEIDGIIAATGTQSHTRVSGDSLADTVRRMITKSYVSGGVRPEFCGMTPETFEGLELAKATTGEYLYVMVNGRVWGLTICESPAFEDPANAGSHYILVGNGTLGARIHDLEDENVEVGVIDKQFVQNTRTLLAEKRLGFSHRIPASFVYCNNTEDGNGYIS
jgi:HK97 family phage major capsid protein